MSHRSSKMVRRAGSIAFLGAAALLLVFKLAGLGCASPEKWAAEAPTTPVVPADNLAGDWLGHWASSKNDMDGALRARIEKRPDGTYQACFDAVFAKIFTSKQEVVLNVRSRGNTWEFSGKQDLGFFKGGVYTYEGRSDGVDFQCSYDSSFDTGTFNMKRLAAATQPAAPAPK